MTGTTFRNRMLLISLLPTTLVALLLSIVFISWNAHEIKVSQKERAHAVARQLGTAVEYGIFSGDHDTLLMLAESTQKSDPEVIGISILDNKGRKLVQIGQVSQELPDLKPAENIVELEDRFIITVRINHTILRVDDIYNDADPQGVRAPGIAGHVALEVSRRHLLDERFKQSLIGIIIAVSGLFLGVLLALHMARGITRPLAHVMDIVDRIGRNELDARVEHHGERILGSLGENINDMAGRIAHTHEQLQQRIEEATLELRLRTEEAERLARIDTLTGIANRRAFTHVLEQEIQRAQRYNSTFSVVIFDLDLFKQINDTYGHGVGDQVLVSRTVTLAASLREIDTFGRLGGEEFGIIMPGTSLEEAQQATERFRAAYDNNPVIALGKEIRSTASFGVAEFSEADLSMETLLSRADEALYIAKSKGRNRVESVAETSSS